MDHRESPSLDKKKLARERFDQEASWYAWSPIHRGASSLERLVELAAPQPFERFLDVATGAGHTAAALKQETRVTLVHACDFTRAMLEQASTSYGYLGIDFVQADAEDLPFASHCLNGVASRSAPHHFPDPLGFLHEVTRVLVPGGRLIVSDPSCVEDREVDDWLNQVETVHDPSHVKNYRLSEWRDMIAKTGLTWEKGDTETRHQRIYSQWMAVVKDPRTTEDLYDRFRQAPQAVRDSFEFRFEEHPGKPAEIIYSVPQAIFLARKPMT